MEDRAAGDDQACARLVDAADVVVVDAAVHLDELPVRDRRPRALEAVDRVLHELLARVPGMDAHAQDEVRVARDARHVLGLRLGIERDTDAEPVLARRRDRPRDVVDGLVVEGDAVAARLRDLREVMHGVVHHQVAVDDAVETVHDRGNRLEHDRPHGDRLDEVAVAHVEVEDADARAEEDLHLLAEPREIGRIQRRLDLDGTNPFLPAHEGRLYVLSLAMKNPLVRFRYGVVRRNSGRRGWMNCGHSSASDTTSRPISSTTASFSSRLVVQTEYRIIPPGRTRSAAERSSPSWSSGSGLARQRRSGRAASTPSPEHGASTRTRSNPVSSGGSAVPSASTTVTFVAPSRAAFARSSLARCGSISTAVTSPRSIVALPPGAAHRSRIRSPSSAPTARPASCEPRLCGQMRPSASARSSTRSTR